MPDLRSLIPAHREIAERVREMFPAEDEETLADSIEGESDLPAAIIAVLRAAIEREVTAEALSDLIETMTARKRRFTEGARNLRLAALHAMEEVGLKKLAAPDMTVSVGTTKPKVLITDDAAVPDDLCRVIRTPSKTDIAKALMDGRDVPGVTLGNPENAFDDSSPVIMDTNGIGQLIAALAKAQAKFEVPLKTKLAKIRSEKGTYEYRYSDLADLIAAVRGPLSENELVFYHCLTPVEGGTMVRAILAHSSGQMLESEYTLPRYQRPQEFGSALTYARRYTLSGLLGVAADDDDDGQAADAQRAPAEPARRPTRPAAPVGSGGDAISTDGSPGRSPTGDHPRWGEANDAYTRIERAIGGAATPKMVDELMRANDVFLALIKDVSVPDYENLMAISVARQNELSAP